jgi:hypothetical protein
VQALLHDPGTADRLIGFLGRHPGWRPPAM